VKPNGRKKISPRAKAARKVRGPGRARKDTVREDVRIHSHGAVANESELPPLARLIEAFEKEKIPYLAAGMSAAVLQGIPGSTLDFDLWIGIPSRQYTRVLQLCKNLGFSILANTVVALPDDTTVNFVYEVHGLASFKTEKRRAAKAVLFGKKIPVLSLEQILQSKKFINRPKDQPHIFLIEKVLKLRSKGGSA
jgi:hypothetical protein